MVSLFNCFLRSKWAIISNPYGSTLQNVCYQATPFLLNFPSNGDGKDRLSYPNCKLIRVLTYNGIEVGSKVELNLMLYYKCFY